LLTGCTGFIGRHIGEVLREQGITVRGLSRGAFCKPSIPSVDLMRGDLSRPETLIGIAKGIDTIIHAAGHAHSLGSDTGMHWKITLEGTRHLLAEAEKEGVRRFIFISSVKAMPDPGNDCIDESETRMPADVYGLSRRRAEDLVLEAGQRTDMHVSILRPALVYGPGCKGNLASMLSWIDHGLFPPVPETGNIRSMVDVRDLVRGILLAAEQPAANGGVFIITDGEDYSTHRIYSAMRTAFGKTLPRWSVPAWLLRALGKAGDGYEAFLGRPAPINSALCSRLLDSACYRSNCAEQKLGFRPEYRLEDALPAMVEAYRNSLR
jgi:UDP-glucose 4-epimerase